MWSQEGKGRNIADVLMDCEMCLTLEILWEWSLEQSWGGWGMRLGKSSGCWARPSASGWQPCHPANDEQVYPPLHAMIKNNHRLSHKISQSGGTLLPELGLSPPLCRGKRVTACLGDCRLPCSCPPSRTWAAPAGTRQSSPCLTSPKTARSLEGGKNLWVTLPHTAYSQNNLVLGKRVERMIVMHKRRFVRWKTHFSTIDPLCVVAHLQQGGSGWYQTVCIRPSCQSDAEVSF